MVVNDKARPEIVNSVNAARHTIGCDIEVVELHKKLKMIGRLSKAGAGGEVIGWQELVDQISKYDFDALAIASEISMPNQVRFNYYKNGGINPYGGVEAIASRLIANAISKPVAHAPIDPDEKEIKMFNEVVGPRIAAEMGTENYIHCVFKGLHKAPRISDSGLHVDDIDCLISPLDCYGSPHKACIEADIPIIAVKENKTCINKRPPKYIEVNNYLEAVGYIQLISTGMTEKSVRV